MRISMLKEAKSKNIMNTLRSLGQFNILVKCMRSTGLIDLLYDKNRTLTLFAPNEQAFKELVPFDRLKNLLNNKEMLRRVISFHLVPDKIHSEHIDKRVIARTLEGGAVFINTWGSLMINNARILRPDIECSNGIIHEIDSVLMP